MKNKTVIAIDPGVSGGVACQLAGTSKPFAFPMPETEGDLLHELAAIKRGSPGEVIAFIEHVTGYRANRRQPGSHMFTFGENFGFIKGALMALEIRMELVRPQAWQRALNLGTSTGLKPRDWKNKLKSRAQQLFPGLKVTLSTADALLILQTAMQTLRE